MKTSRLPWTTAILAACLAALPAFAETPVKISGRVFLDANANGKLDAGERGLPGVRVTDGNNIALTGDDGAYALEIADDPQIPHAQARVVSVGWPSGTWPVGKWWVRLSDLADAGNVHFALRQDKQELPFAYLHVTDSHGATSGYAGLAKWCEHFPEIKFVFNTGDVGYATPDGTEAMFKKEVAALAAFKVPVFTVPGNHDFVGEDWRKPQDNRGHGPYTRHFGPVRWSFGYAGIHFQGVDWVRRIDAGGEGGRGYELRTPQQAVDWMAREYALLQGRPRVVLLDHFPTGVDSFHRLLRARGVEIVHAGHNHAHVWYFYGAPMLTARNCTDKGIGNLALVSRDGIDVGAICLNDRHSRRCPLGWWGHFMSGRIAGWSTPAGSLKDAKLTGRGEAIAVGTDAVFVSATVDLGSAARCGVRIGSGESAILIAFDGTHVIVQDVRVPVRTARGDAPVILRVMMEGNKLTLWADERLFLEKKLSPRKATQVVPFAEGGQAVIRSLSVSNLKPDNKTADGCYVCGCSHGQVLKQFP